MPRLINVCMYLQASSNKGRKVNREWTEGERNTEDGQKERERNTEGGQREREKHMRSGQRKKWEREKI